MGGEFIKLSNWIAGVPYLINGRRLLHVPLVSGCRSISWFVNGIRKVVSDKLIVRKVGTIVAGKYH